MSDTGLTLTNFPETYVIRALHDMALAWLDAFVPVYCRGWA
jgi:hypothetical protein